MEDFLLIEAADSGGEEGQHKPKVTGHAYGGGKMSAPRLETSGRCRSGGNDSAG